MVDAIIDEVDVLCVLFFAPDREFKSALCRVSLEFNLDLHTLVSEALQWIVACVYRTGGVEQRLFAQ